jgi:predicted nucleotidyltransferase
MIRLENHTSWKRIKPKYHSVIDQAVKAYISVFGDSITEIRLQGSVARGDEIENVSDMDFVCILTDNADHSKPRALEDQERTISKMCPELTKVDLDIANEQQLNENLDFSLLLQTDSLCVYGRDRYGIPTWKKCLNPTDEWCWIQKAVSKLTDM